MRCLLVGIGLTALIGLAACSQLIESGDATYRSASSSMVSFVIQSSESRDGDNFGTALALEGDQLFVVASTADLTGVRSAAEASCGDMIDAIDAGRIHSFELGASTWNELRELERTAVAPNEGFITASMGFVTLPRISVARTERTAVVGIPSAAYNDCLAAQTGSPATGRVVTQSGKAYVFELDDDERWRVSAVLTAAEPDTDHLFGTNVAIRGDQIFVAAPAEDGSPVEPGQDETIDESGAVYVFMRDGKTFRREQRLEPSNRLTAAQFGSALSVDGDTLAVGAWRDAHDECRIHGAPMPEAIGAAYVFRERDGQWEQEAYIKAPNCENGDLFGMSIAVRGDLLLVGAPFEAGSHPTVRIRSASDLEDIDRNGANGAGAVYAFARESDAWQFHSYIKPFEPDEGLAFGVALRYDAGRLLVGAPYQNAIDDATGRLLANAGAAYLYELRDDAFERTASFLPAMSHHEGLFGFAVDMDGPIVAIGAPENMHGLGSVSVFDLSDLDRR